MGSDQLEQLESDFQIAFAKKSPLQEWRKRGWEKFLDLEPNLAPYPIPKIAPIPEAKTAKISFSNHLLFVDGHFQSHVTPKSVTAQNLDSAMKSYGLFLQNWFARSLKEERDPFAALNMALHGNGAFLYVPPKVQIKEPIEIHHLFTSSQFVCSHLHIVLGKGASLSLVQRVTTSISNPFANIRWDAFVDEGASLYIEDHGGWPQNAIRWEMSKISLKKKSKLHFLSLTQGSKEGNISLDVKLLEEEANACVQGFSHLKGNLLKIHSFMEHIAPHCQSRQHFKTILEKSSQSLFKGKIYIHPEAQKTEAYQLNNNLILSEKALSKAEPHLEIFADDVKASHGATFAAVSVAELFYLQSRGITTEEAKKLLIQGFSNEILKKACYTRR